MKGFRKAVTRQAVRAHQAALPAVADASGDNRLAGTPGHDASADYVAARAAAAGYEVSFHEWAEGEKTPAQVAVYGARRASSTIPATTWPATRSPTTATRGSTR